MREPVMVFQFFAAMKVFGPTLFTAFRVEYLLFLGVMLCLLFLIKTSFHPLYALLSSLIWITYRPLKSLFINNTGDLSAAFWFMFGLLLLSKYQKHNKWYFLISSGIAFGLAILSRSAMLIPTGVILVAIVVEPLIKNRFVAQKHLKESLILLLMVTAIVAPWIVRNYLVFGKPMMTSLTGYNLFRHNAPIQKPNYLHYVGSIEAKKYQTRFLKTLPYSIETADEGEMNQIYQDAAFKIISQYPDRYIALSLYRFIPLWFNIGVPDEWQKEDTFIFIQQAILLVLLLAGIILSRPRPWMYIACVAAYCAGHMAIDGQVRYLIPMIPLILYIGMSGLARLMRDQP